MFAADTIGQATRRTISRFQRALASGRGRPAQTKGLSHQSARCWTLRLGAGPCGYVLDLVAMFWTLWLCSGPCGYLLDLVAICWTLWLCGGPSDDLLDLAAIWWTEVLVARRLLPERRWDWTGLRYLETELEGELKSAALVQGVGNLAKAGGADLFAGLGELRSI